MKYNVLLKLLRFLVLTKRSVWWLGAGLYFVLAGFFGLFWRPLAYINYKLSYIFKKLKIGKSGLWFLKRDYLQFLIFLVLFFAAIPQTKIYGKMYAQSETYQPGQRTIAYSLFGAEEDVGAEEIVVGTSPIEPAGQNWRTGALSPQDRPAAQINWREQELSGLSAGGTAVTKPFIIPGSIVAGTRDRPTTYLVMAGDSLSSIAYQFGVNVPTILWENKLTLRSIIRPGDKLVIPPAIGIMHTIKKSDTVKKIATLYRAKQEDIIKFNKLKEDGSDLKVGERIMVPNGVQPAAPAPVIVRGETNVYRQAAPTASRQAPSASGFVWPCAARTITQYYGWRHHALDISGSGALGTPIYAAKSGSVEIAQCGWNSGYGCYIVINHGNGIKTLYGHNSKLLVIPGEYVTVGQTIALMGRTGKVRGPTGVHSHFEIQINGVRVNPLGYVR